MSRSSENNRSGREADRLRDGLFKRGVLTPPRDSHRGANEGLGQREINALAAENDRPWGTNPVKAVIHDRCKKAGHDVSCGCY